MRHNSHGAILARDAYCTRRRLSTRYRREQVKPCIVSRLLCTSCCQDSGRNIQSCCKFSYGAGSDYSRESHYQRHSQTGIQKVVLIISQLVRTVPRRGRLETGGNDLRANALFRGIKALYDDPQGRMNALMLIIRTAKLTSALFISHLPFLREMADVLGFPLQIDEAASGLNDFLDIQDGGIRVRPAGKERVAAQALLELGR